MRGEEQHSWITTIFNRDKHSHLIIFSIYKCYFFLSVFSLSPQKIGWFLGHLFGKIGLKDRFIQMCKEEKNLAGRQQVNTAEVTGMLAFMLTKKQTGLAYRWRWEGSTFASEENSVHKQGKPGAVEIFESWMCEEKIIRYKLKYWENSLRDTVLVVIDWNNISNSTFLQSFKSRT